MASRFRSHLIASVVGGLLVVGVLAAVGDLDGPRTETIVEEAPVSAQPSAGSRSTLTANAIYQRDAPAVVYVRAVIVAPDQSPFGPFNDSDSDTSTGSGFLVDRHGDILTDYDVVDGADRSNGVTVEFAGGQFRGASVVAADPQDDLAVLHVNMRGVGPVLPLPLGDSTTVRVGDPTLALGNPFGLDRTLTSGIVSALAHVIQAADGQSIDNVIETDQLFDAANAGGPLLNADGDVIGIDSQIAIAGGTGAQPLAFAVPIDTADPILAQVDHGGPVRLAYLGLGSAPSRPAVGRPRAIVGGIVKGSPAAQAGLRSGDDIVRVDGLAVRSLAEVMAIVRTRSPGQTMTLEVHAGRRLQSITVTLGSRTAPTGSQ
jgi:S1-C subfamily serine protease